MEGITEIDKTAYIDEETFPLSYPWQSFGTPDRTDNRSLPRPQG